MINMPKINFGLIGCGAVARKHGEAIKNIDEAQLVAVADTVEDCAKSFAEQYGGKVYTDYRELLADPNVDAVIVATPSGLHAPIGLEVLEAKKHALIEKPLALTVEDAEKLIQKAKEVDRCLSTVHPNRYYPNVQRAYKAVKEGHLGRLSHAVATVRWNRTQEYYDQAPWRKTREMDGGILFNQAWHALDLLLWFMGPVVKSHFMGARRCHDIETQDVVVLSAKFSNGALGLLEATTNVYSHNLEETLNVFGSLGTIILGGSRIDETKLWEVKNHNNENTIPHREIQSLVSNRSWAHQQSIKEFISQIASKQTALSAVNDAVIMLKLIENCQGCL